MAKNARDTSSTDLGMRIRARREEMGWIQDRLAKKAGCTKGAVSQWESGYTKNLRLNRLLSVADALDVEMRWLITGELPKRRQKVGIAFQAPPEEAEPIERLRDALPEWRRFVLRLAAMTDREKQRAYLSYERFFMWFLNERISGAVTIPDDGPQGPKRR